MIAHPEVVKPNVAKDLSQRTERRSKFCMWWVPRVFLQGCQLSILRCLRLWSAHGDAIPPRRLFASSLVSQNRKNRKVTEPPRAGPMFVLLCQRYTNGWHSNVQWPKCLSQTYQTIRTCGVQTRFERVRRSRSIIDSD